MYTKRMKKDATVRCYLTYCIIFDNYHTISNYLTFLNIILVNNVFTNSPTIQN